MARQLKRWESPRKEGRNTKGKGGSARQRQRRKQLQRLRQTLKDSPHPSDLNGHHSPGGSSNAPPFYAVFMQFSFAWHSNPHRTSSRGLIRL